MSQQYLQDPFEAQDAHISERSVRLVLRDELLQLRERMHAECVQADLRSAHAESSFALAVSSFSERLDALESVQAEAICQDVRRSLQAASPLPEATIELIKAELKGELHQLREHLHAHCLKAELQSANATAIGLAVCSLSQEMAALRDCLTSAVARCESQLAEVELLHVRLGQDVTTEAHNIIEQARQEATNWLLEIVRAEQIDFSKRLQDAAFTAGGGGQVAVLAQRLSDVQEEQRATSSTVKSVSNSVAKAAAGIRHAIQDVACSRLSGLEASVTPAAISTSKSHVDACNLSHLQTIIAACAENNSSAQVEIEGVKKRVLELENAVIALEKTVSWALLDAPSARHLVVAEALALGLSNGSRHQSCSCIAETTPSTPQLSTPRTVSLVSNPELVASPHTSHAQLPSDTSGMQKASCSVLDEGISQAPKWCKLFSHPIPSRGPVET